MGIRNTISEATIPPIASLPIPCSSDPPLNSIAYNILMNMSIPVRSSTEHTQGSITPESPPSHRSDRSMPPDEPSRAALNSSQANDFHTLYAEPSSSLNTADVSTVSNHSSINSFCTPPLPHPIRHSNSRRHQVIHLTEHDQHLLFPLRSLLHFQHPDMEGIAATTKSEHYTTSVCPLIPV